jgi:hypothetical protein
MLEFRNRHISNAARAGNLRVNAAMAVVGVHQILDDWRVSSTR